LVGTDNKGIRIFRTDDERLGFRQLKRQGFGIAASESFLDDVFINARSTDLKLKSGLAQESGADGTAGSQNEMGWRHNFLYLIVFSAVSAQKTF
jgi:hypothetical protein